MLIGCHGLGHFGEARKNMNYTALTVCLKDPIILSYQINITYQQNIISRVINTVSPKVTQFSYLTLTQMHTAHKNFIWVFF